MMMLQKENPQSQFEKIWEIVKWLTGFVDDLIRTGARAVVFMYYRAFWNTFEHSIALLATARAIGVMMVIAMLLIVTNKLFDAWE